MNASTTRADGSSAALSERDDAVCEYAPYIRPATRSLQLHQRKSQGDFRVSYLRRP